MNPDVCVFCTASGCLDATAEHSTECPFTTGLWPITPEDVKRGAMCAACDEPFAHGDVAAQVSDPEHPAMAGAMPGATFSICVGCWALGEKVR